MKDATVSAGESAKFQTTVETGLPTPEVTWYLKGKDAADLQRNGKCEIVRRGNICKLAINNCELTDSGSVVVEAKNTVDNDKKTATLFVGGSLYIDCFSHHYFVLLTMKCLSDFDTGEYFRFYEKCQSLQNCTKIYHYLVRSV